MTDLDKLYPDDRCTITYADVRKIRSLRGKVSQKELAFQFGVTQAQISRILSNSRWADKSKKTTCTKCGKES